MSARATLGGNKALSMKPAVWLTAFVCAFAFVAPSIAFTAKQNGFNFLNGQWSSPKYNSSLASEAFQAMVNQTNPNWVTLTFCWYQKTVDTVGPIYAIEGKTPSHTELESVVTSAHKLGLKVVLRPLVDPDWRNPETQGTWRGQIGRHFTSEDWNSWFASYETMLVSYAKLGQTWDVEEFSVGGELIIASWQESHWREVVKQVRSVFSGPLVYAANHGNELAVQWWDAVDFIGVDAYYPIAPSVSLPSLEELKTGWKPIVDSLAALTTKYNRPLLFGEVGYCSVTGAHSDPAHCDDPTLLNLTAQSSCYEALFETVYQQHWFAGVFWWAWLTDPSDGGPQNAGFAVNDKPTAEIVRKFFSQP